MLEVYKTVSPGNNDISLDNQNISQRPLSGKTRPTLKAPVKYFSSIQHELTSQTKACYTSKGILDMHSIIEVPSARQWEL